MDLLPVRDQTRKLPTLKETSAHQRSLLKLTLTICLMKSSVPRKRNPKRVKRTRGRRPPRMRTKAMMMSQSRVRQSTLYLRVYLYPDHAHDHHKPLPLSLKKSLKRNPPLLKMPGMLGTQVQSCYPKRRRRS